MPAPISKPRLWRGFFCPKIMFIAPPPSRPTQTPHLCYERCNVISTAGMALLMFHTSYHSLLKGKSLMLHLEKSWRLPGKRENTGPPERVSTCYCFGLLIATSGAVEPAIPQQQGFG